MPDQAFYEALIATSPLVVVLASRENGHVRYLSPNASRVFGWDDAQVADLHGPWWELVHPDEQDATAAAFAGGRPM